MRPDPMSADAGRMFWVLASMLSGPVSSSHQGGSGAKVRPKPFGTRKHAPDEKQERPRKGTLPPQVSRKDYRISIV